MTIEYEELMDGTQKVMVDEDHYKRGSIEPIDYIEANKLDFKRGNIVKYASRDQYKGGSDDIKKVINYAVYCLKYDYCYTDEQIAAYLKEKFINAK